MPNMKRPSQNRQSSNRTITQFSEDRTKSAPTVGTSSCRPATSLSQRLANTAGPSTSYLAVNGEFQRSTKHSVDEGSRVCAAQMDVDNDPHGTTNPVSFEFDHSTGYLPVTDHASKVPQSVDQQSVLDPERSCSSLEPFLQIVSSERLSRMPHRASSWDRIIRVLEGLALDMSTLLSCGESLSATRANASSQLYTACFNILRVCSHCPSFLEFAIPILSSVRGLVSITLRQMLLRKDIFGKSELVQQRLDVFLVVVLEIINKTMVTGQDLASNKNVENDLFKWSIRALQDRQDQIVTSLWVSQLSHENDSSQDFLSQVSRMIESLRPQDPMVPIVYSNLQATRKLHAEFTCEWFSQPLLDFTRSSDKAFLIEGPPGCGKSMLFGWILDSLQNKVGGRDFYVLDYSLDPLLPSELGVPALLKGILQKAFELFPGFQSLHNNLRHVVHTATSSAQISKLNESLWTTLMAVLQNISAPTIMVLDGLSELDDDGPAARSVLERLLPGVSNSSMVKLLLLSRPLEQPPMMEIRRFDIRHTHVQEDIRRVIDKAIARNNPDSHPEATDWVMSKANGSFLWGLLVIQIWNLDILSGSPVPPKSLPTSLGATASLLISRIDLGNPAIRMLLLYSLVALRPLHVDEAQALLNVDLESFSFNNQYVDIQETVKQGCESILVVDDSMVRFRHSIFKQSLREIAHKRLNSSLQDIHREVLERLLQYLRLAVNNRSELTLKPIATSVLEESLRSHKLAAYALRYWTFHYAQSSLSRNTEARHPARDLEFVFPASTFVASLEAAYWTSKPLSEALQPLQVARQARQEVLGSHLATLQTTALLAVFLQRVRMLPDAALHYANAFQLALQLLPEFHDFTTTCVTECLQCTKSSTASPDLPMTVPDMLRYLIAKDSKQLGPGNDRALENYRLLAHYYADNDQHELSTQVQHDIYRLTMDRFGKSSVQAKAVAGDLAALLSGQPESHSQYNDLIYDNVTTAFPVTDSRRIQASIMKAESFRTQNPLDAELEYLNLLHDLAEDAQYDDEEGQRNLATVTLRYAGFLTEQERREEAQSVLLGLWRCFEGHQNVATATDELLKELASNFQQAELPAVALKILGMVAERSKMSNDDTRELQETISRITRASMKDIESGGILHKSTEDALLQAFESAKSRPSAMNASFLRNCRALIESFVLETRWQDVLYVASSVLHYLWPSVLDDAGDALPPSDFDPIMGDIAFRLAQSYSVPANNMTDAEILAGQIYWNLLRSGKESGVMHSTFFENTARAALVLFEKTGQTKKMSSVAQELVNHCSTSFGEDHPATIDAIYQLASLYMDNGELELAGKQYEKIATSLQKDGFHAQRALPALQALLVIYRSRKLWSEAEQVYSHLWRTFLAKGKEFRISEDVARDLHKEHSQLLENQLGANPELMHQVQEEYQEGCVSAFGRQARITIESTMRLAESWERRQPDSPEAIHLYESIIDAELDENGMEDVLDQAAAILRRYYIAHLDTDMNQQTLTRAVKLQREHYESDKRSFGFPSPRTLSSLATLVSLLSKHSSLECKNLAIGHLQQAIDSILRSDLEGKALVDAATILASSYATNGYLQEGLERLQALREHMIFYEAPGETGTVSAGREVFGPDHRSKLTLLTAFETGLGGSSTDFAAIHSRVLFEVALRESFQAMDRTDSSVEAILTRGSRLYALLTDHYPSYKGESLQRRLFDLFMDKYGSAFTAGGPKFFKVLLKALSVQRHQVDLPHLACAALNEEAQSLADQRKFSELLEVSTPGFDFIRYAKAYENAENFGYGMELGLILGDECSSAASEQSINKQMLELSKLILREVLQLSRSNNFDLEKISIDELSRVAAVLGRQQNYYDLEWLLNRLWLSRHRRGVLSQDIIVMLGRRLVDVRFFHGHVDSAIDLAEDILYNLRQVYGPLHPSAVQMMNLLSSMYMSKGDRAAAMAVHEGTDSSIAKTAFADNRDILVPKDSSHADSAIRSKIEHLLQCYQQGDGSEHSMRQSSTLLDELTKRLSAPVSISKNPAVGGHRPPSNWSFAADDEKDQSVRFEELA